MLNTKEKLEPVLIRKDEKLIAAEKAHLKRMLTDAQDVYDLFLKIDLRVTIGRIQSLLNKRNEVNKLKSFVADEIIKKTDLKNFGGLPINKDKLKELIDVPDLSDIEATVKSLSAYYATQGNQFKGDLIAISNDTLSIVAGAEDQIEQNNTHYTATELGHTIAHKLLALSRETMELAEIIGTDKKGNPVFRAEKVNIPGLINEFEDLPEEKHYHTATQAGTVLITKKHIGHRIDLGFIRKYERIAGSE